MTTADSPTTDRASRVEVEQTRLKERLERMSVAGMTKLHVSWAPEAEAISREERAKAINEMLDQQEAWEALPVEERMRRQMAEVYEKVTLAMELLPRLSSKQFSEQRGMTADQRLISTSICDLDFAAVFLGNWLDRETIKAIRDRVKAAAEAERTKIESETRPSPVALDGLENCRPQILAFALLMERELRANEHKGGWENDHPVGLCDHLDEETRELRAVVNARWEIVWGPAADRFDRGNGWSRQNPDTGVREIGCGYKMLEQPWLGANSERIASEAADVANMAMMVADVCDALPALPKALAERGELVEEAVKVLEQLIAGYEPMVNPMTGEMVPIGISKPDLRAARDLHAKLIALRDVKGT